MEKQLTEQAASRIARQLGRRGGYKAAANMTARERRERAPKASKAAAIKRSAEADARREAVHA